MGVLYGYHCWLVIFRSRNAGECAKSPMGGFSWEKMCLYKHYPLAPMDATVYVHIHEAAGYSFGLHTSTVFQCFFTIGDHQQRDRVKKQHTFILPAHSSWASRLDSNMPGSSIVLSYSLKKTHTRASGRPSVGGVNWEPGESHAIVGSRSQVPKCCNF